MVQIYSIEGNIGSGKSTLIRLLKQINKKIIFVLEPVDDWETIQDETGENILTKFYNNQEKYSFSFQMMAYISRLAKLKKIINEIDNEAIIITERSILTDKNVFAKMLYDDDKIEEVNYQIYLRWFNEFIKDIQQSGYIYLDVSPEICYQRVLKRNRPGELISLVYLNQCHVYHANWLQQEKNVLIIDGTDDFEHNIKNLNKLSYNIQLFINKEKKSDDEDNYIYTYFGS